MSTFKIRQGNNSEPITKTFRIPADMVMKLEALSAVSCLSMNQLVNQALEFALENLEIDDKQRAEYEKRIKNL